jgi:hypothetical protein
VIGGNKCSLILALCAISLPVGCGGGDEESSAGGDADAPDVEQAEQEITELLEAWAPSFGDASSNACGYMNPDLCDAYIYGNTVSTPAWQEDFADAEPTSVEVSGSTADAQFNNGETVGLQKVGDLWEVSELPHEP